MNIIQPGGRIKLWFTQYDSLNDKTERAEFFNFLKRYCLRREDAGKFSSAFCERIANLKGSDRCIISLRDADWTNSDGQKVPTTHVKAMECDTYLCCFSTESDSLAMWNYYSKSDWYEGYSIEFFNNDYTFGCFEKGYSLTVQKVLYSETEKTTLLDEILIPFAQVYEKVTDEYKEKIISFIQSEINQLQFAFKSSCFEHEKEVRAILRVPKNGFDDCQRFERRYRTNKGIIIPYVELDIAESSIGRITIAPLLESNIAKKNAEDFLSSRGHNVFVETSRVPIRF